MNPLLAARGLPTTIDGSVSHDSIPWMIGIAREIRRDVRRASGEGSPYTSGRRSWALPATDGHEASSISIIERPWWRDEQYGIGGTRRWRVPCRVVVVERETAGATTTRIVEHVRSDLSNSPDASNPSALLTVALRVATTLHATALRATAHLASSHPESGYPVPSECRTEAAGRALSAMLSREDSGFRGFRIDLASCAPYSHQPVIRIGANPNAVVPTVPDADALIPPQGSLELWDDRKTDRPAFTLALMRRRMGQIDVPREPVDAVEAMRTISRSHGIAA